MSITAAVIYREAMIGVKFLHDNSRIHRDIKPPNIGILPGKPPRAVLLDVGQAKELDLGSNLPATPGYSGTVNYLSPGREITEYDHGVDIWALGVIGHQLTYGYHPFEFKINPWRGGEKHEEIRPAFQQRYQEAIDRMSIDYDRYRGQKASDRNPSFIHRKCHQAADCNTC